MNNDDGRCFPSIKTLAVECSLSDKTVRNSIKELESANFISRVTGNGRSNTTQYHLHPIQSDVDNLNKHQGNPSTLLSNYSPDKDVNPSDFPQEDFELELKHEPNNTQCKRTPEIESNVIRADHLVVLEPIHRRSALLHLEHHGNYFNEHYRKWLDEKGQEVELDGADF